MTEENAGHSLKSDELWLKIINEGIEDRVEVNQRMLIDKMLSRYSSDFVIYRELIQNSDDAQSTSFTLEIDCDPTSSTSNYQSIHLKEKKNLFENIGNLFKNQFYSNNSSLSLSSNKSFEENLNNCIINEIRTINNGNVFTEDDWKRVITIAEGNTNVDAIGQFGVGFFSVFSLSEKPIIKSGKQCLAFVWQNGKSLTTFRKELSNEEQINTTTIILSMKNKFILETINNLTITTKAKKDLLTNEIIPTLDLIKLKIYFIKVLSFTKYLKELIIKINNKIIFQINKISKDIQSNKLLLAPKQFNSNNDYNLFKFISFKQTEELFTILNGPSITLEHIHVQANIIIDQQFQLQIEKVLKKQLPKTIYIQFLFPSNNIFEDEQLKSFSNNNILKELIPLKYINEEIKVEGQIFIGLATHQTTGIGMHVFTHLIPTIERENIDLQDPYISIWNEQLLISIGKILRFIYDQTILNTINNTFKQTNQFINFILSSFAFQTSSPNKDIGRFILDGFLSIDKDILVPVKRLPSDEYLSLIPSTEAYLSNSKYIEKFLPIPLVPYELGINDFLKTLKRSKWIEEINNDIILDKISNIILSLDDFIGLLHWLCTNDINKNKLFIKNILRKITYRDNNKIIKLENIKYFDILNEIDLPLPLNVLPSNIVNYISYDHLKKYLLLLPITYKDLINFYLNKNEEYLLLNENTSTIILNFISKYINKLNENEINEIKIKLSNLKCIPTTNGMKIPNESYIKSYSISSHLSIIKLTLNHLNNKEFFKLIGCRSIYISSSSLQEIQSNENFIKNLLEQKINLSHNDINALKTTECILGKRFQSNEIDKNKYKPNELYFPDIAEKLQWNNLLILDWINIEKNSEEYLFLKQIGIKQYPDLNQLILRIVQEHQNKSSYNINHYKLPLAFTFFIENFQEYYSKLWINYKNDIPFIPSILPNSDQVILTLPQFVYKELNPLFPSLINDVIHFCSLYIDLNIIGIKIQPELSKAFYYLIENRNQLLNIQTASIYFSYFNKLNGINKQFIENISKIDFIPIKNNENNLIYVKTNEVFIKSKDNLNDNNINDLIDYIDYGYESNSFLLSSGVLSYPSPSILAYLLINKQENYFKNLLNEKEDIILCKLNIYTNYLKQLSISLNLTNQLLNEPLKTHLKTNKWCLAYKNTSDIKQKIFQIVKPSDIYLDDDHQSIIDINPLCAPDEPELIKLYQTFGAKWLSENIQRTLIHKGKVFSSERSNELFHLINYRLDMLFVNNRGERLENIDEKRFQLLKNSFSVYESESIQCEINFQNKIYILNSNQCSSCALEFNRINIILYIHKDLPTLDYIDISTELTRFICKKTHHTLIHSITDKLSSPLETLKRRGIPVDRLLKIQQKQQINLTLQIEENNREEKLIVEKENNNHIKELKDNNEYSKGFFQNLKDLLIPKDISQSSIENNFMENFQSNIQINRQNNFNENKLNDDNDINLMISSSKPYLDKQLIEKEKSKYEINNSCEYIPSSNMIRYEKLLNGISLYIDINVILNNYIILNGKQLSYLLSSLAIKVFNLPIETIHLFHDIDSARIAFNKNGSLFYNLRYFQQIYSNDLKKSIENGLSLSSSLNPIIRQIVNFYYMVTCHELTHNIHLNHDLNFINRLENVSVKFMDKKDEFISKFSF